MSRTVGRRRARIAAGCLPVALLAAALGGPAAGAEEPEAGRDGETDALLRKILEEERDVELRRVGLLRLRASRSQGISAAVGLMRVRQPATYDCRTACAYRGPFVQIEPGLGGIQLAGGWARLVAETRRTERFLSAVYVGYGVKGVLLHTWDDRLIDPAGQSFAGIEGAFSITTVNFSLAVLRGIDRGPEDRRWLVTGGLGWGF